MSKRSAASPAPLSLVKRRRAQYQSHSVSRDHKVSLEKIVGLTCVTSNGLSVSSETGCVAYPAGCVAVLHLPKKNRQLHILNTSKKPISSVCLSADGKYLAIGEYGHQPSVQVWNVAGSPNHVAELKAHKFGIQCMAFSPSMKYMVSVGYQHDMHIHVWNWRAGWRVATNKITSKVYGLSFSEDGKYFVTVGNRRVRFWTMLSPNRDDNHPAPLKGRSAILGDLQDNCFVAVGCGRGTIASFTYALTRSGVLCKFDQDRTMDQFVDVLAGSQAGCGRSLSLCESYVVCGCGGGVARLFDPCTLTYLHTLPLPHPLGVDVAVSLKTSWEGKGKFPDTVAMALDSTNRRLSVVYSDHSHYVWDIANLCQIGKLHSSLHHSACIWDLCLYPALSSDDGAGVLPPSCLVTCSSDNTIRLWSMDTTPHSRPGSTFVKNVYSKELMKVIYADPDDLSSLNDASKYPGDASAVADSQRGVRCVQFHPRGHQLATGDRAGSIRVYELQFMDVVFEVEAHISEVLCIQYSPLYNGLQFMCSASRDRLIHVFTVADHYQHIQTIDDHSASITALQFTTRSGLKLLSCGADKSIMYRTLQKAPSVEFQRTSHIACKASIYDMDIDVVGKHVVTAGQDRMLRVYQLATGKQKSLIKASTGEDGSLIKVAMDPSGLYVACSSSDKTILLFDFYSGECLAKLYGHSEVVTQIKFSFDCKFLYSVSGDGCIFVWRLSEDITQTMHDRLAEMGIPVSPAVELTPIRTPPSSRRGTYSVSKATNTDAMVTEESVDSAEDADVPFRLSVSQLPGWAQRQVQARPSIAQSFSTSALERAGRRGDRGGGREEGGGVEGCWAERVPKTSSGSLLSQTASAPDVTVIDLTGDSPEREDVKKGEEEEEEEEGNGEGVFYPPLTASIDPSVFKVTTPVKKTQRQQSVMQEEEEGEEEGEGEGENSGRSSGPSPVDFLKTTFESLSSENVDAFFSCTSPDPHDLRLSISARFFSQSAKCRLADNVTVCRKSWSSPDLPVPVSRDPVKSVPPVVEETSHQEREGEMVEDIERGEEGEREGEMVEDIERGEEGEREGEMVEDIERGEDGEREGEVVEDIERGEEGEREKEVGYNEGVVAESEVVEGKTGVDTECTTTNSSDDKKTKRSPAIQEEIDKTRRRLAELGYGAVGKPSAVVTSSKKGAATTPSHSPPHHHTSHQAQISQKRQHHSTGTTTTTEPDRTGSLAREGGVSRDEETSSDTLLTRVTQCIADITEGFRNMTKLHQLALDGLASCQDQGGGGGEGRAGRGGGRQECEDAISAIATAVNSLKSQSVSMANRHRRRWRELARARGSGRELESLGSSGESAEDTGDKGTGLEGGVDGRGSTPEEEGEMGGGDVMSRPEVLDLLERYSQQLLQLVHEQTTH